MCGQGRNDRTVLFIDVSNFLLSYFSRLIAQIISKSIDINKHYCMKFDVFRFAVFGAELKFYGGCFI